MKYTVIARKHRSATDSLRTRLSEVHMARAKHMAIHLSFTDQVMSFKETVSDSLSFFLSSFFLQLVPVWFL